MRSREAAFTMIELMLVVVIVGILVAVAVYAYSRSVRKARSTEVVTMFGEIKMREEAYKAEFGKYLPMCPNPAGGADELDCVESDKWPNPLPGKGQAIDITGGLPARWQTLKVNPGKGSLYCQYVVVAGKAGSTVPAAYPSGQLLYGNTPVPTNWYYLVAQCDWDNDPAVNAVYWQRGDSSELYKDNELR
ncbi:MAG TPA: prepilin-type N-terminal cleavage/methylation domain-containing protein [Haliangiales bacterium]|nr:prepilin-type N-terminal cleavage/methylation domain-containing protein [Haliangiales bacterium]